MLLKDSFWNEDTCFALTQTLNLFSALEEHEFLIIIFIVL